MPNWCINQLHVTGDEEAIAEFIAEATHDSDSAEYCITFTHTLPIPKEVSEAKGDAWYNWCVDNWGTKWDIEPEPPITEELGKLVWQFSTAWGPPEAWLSFISKKYPELNFQLAFEEPGMDFSGVATYEAGEPVEELCWSTRAMSWINCAIEDCSEYENGPAASFAPWEFLTGQPDENLWNVYCEKHKLEEVVISELGLKPGRKKQKA